MHRAEQVLDAIVGILTTAGIQGVGKHRLLEYERLTELPAVSVRMGVDQPPGISNIPIIDSELLVSIVAVVSEATEAEAVTALMALRSSTHIALMADRTLGLAFVSDCRYAGALAPEMETDPKAEHIAGRLETQWIVPYRMNLASPE